jgi:hypothetical protein
MSRSAAKQADLFALQATAESGSSRTDADSRRIRLPSDLSASLKYVDDDELERLREAISSVIHRGSLSLPQTRTVALSSSPDHRSLHRNKQEQGPREIPVGKASQSTHRSRRGLNRQQ